MKCFKIDSIGYGWFEFRIGMYYVETSDFLGYDMPTEFLNKLIKVLKGSSKEWVYVMNEPGADILEILRSDNMITVNSYSMNKPSTELSSEIEEELKNIGEHEFSISINIPELVDAVVTEYSLYENGNGRKCFDLNWGGYPQKEYDELKRIAIEINKNQGKYDKLNCMEDWRYINSQREIEEFVKETMGMHDTVMVGLDYMAGTWGDDMATYFSGPNSKNLRVIFISPWTNGNIEMIFETVCRFNISGWQECYSDEILECSISLEKLKKNSDETYVLWTSGGTPRACGKEELLLEPIDTYIISKRVRWRITKLNYKCPCCGYYTFGHPPMGELDNCPVCCWFDDTECLGDLDYVNACLGISLRQARKNFLVKRACKDEFMSEVRLPLENELDGINWIIPSKKW